MLFKKGFEIEEIILSILKYRTKIAFDKKKIQEIRYIFCF